MTLTEPTPAIDERNAHMMRVSKVLKLRNITGSESFLPPLTSTSLSSHLSLQSTAYLTSLGVVATGISGVLMEGLFVPHEPVFGVELPSQYLSNEAMRGSPHHMAPGKFDIHVLSLEQGEVQEIHGIAHLNPFSMDPRLPAVLAQQRDGIFQGFRWFYYVVTMINSSERSQKGPIMEGRPQVAANMITFCTISHFVKFGHDDQMLRPPVEAQGGGARPQNVETAQASLLGNRA